MPALSVAVQVTLWDPTELVSTAPQLEEARPERPSLAFAEAVALPLSRTGFGETLGEREGAVLSTIKDWVLLDELPARSMQVPVADWAVPSPLVAALVEALTAPDKTSVQLQLAVTSLLYQPEVDGPTNAIWGAVLSILIPLTPSTYLKGYLDVQIWLSLGYCF